MEALRGEFDSAWAKFQTLESLHLVPDTLEAEWSRGRDTYLAFLIPIVDTAIAANLRELSLAVGGIPGVEAYPEDYWHITIKGVGFEVEGASGAESVSSARVTDIAAAGGDVFGDQQSFEARIGLASAFQEVVFAEVWDAGQVRALNGRLLAAIPDLVRYPFDGPNFLPHISIARFTSNEGLPQLKDAIAHLRAREPGPKFHVYEAQFIRARLSERAPRLETIEIYSLE
jgi:2'-5' RNA ligase